MTLKECDGDKNYFVYRKQALILPIATIQGLSLDCTIVDLSENIFAPCMAYTSHCGHIFTGFNLAELNVGCLEE